MAKLKFKVTIVKEVEVEYDSVTTFTPEVMKEYNEHITYVGDEAKEHAENIATLYAREVVDDDFIEGYGSLKERQIKLKVLEEYADAEHVPDPWWKPAGYN